MPKMIYLSLLPVAFLVWFLIWFFSPVARAQPIYFHPVPTVQLTIPKLKAMIRAVENTKWQVVGAAGERSSYSILEATWKMWSSEPFEWASSRQPLCIAETEQVVSKHLAYIKGVLEKSGFTQTPYSVACIWKAGEARWSDHRLRPVDMDYARRAANLYLAVNKVGP